VGSVAVGGGGGPRRWRLSTKFLIRSSLSSGTQSNTRNRLSFSKIVTISFIWEGLDLRASLVLSMQHKTVKKLVGVGYEDFKFQTIGGNRMVGPLGKVASPFRSTYRKRGGDCITTTRRRVVGKIKAERVSRVTELPF